MIKKFTDKEWETYLEEKQTCFIGNPDPLRILLEEDVTGWNRWRKKRPGVTPKLPKAKTCKALIFIMQT